MAIEKAHQKNCAILVADMLANDERVVRFFPAEAVAQYVRKHRGCVVFAVTEGLIWSKHFQQKRFPELAWRDGGYYSRSPLIVGPFIVESH